MPYNINFNLQQLFQVFQVRKSGSKIYRLSRNCILYGGRFYFEPHCRWQQYWSNSSGQENRHKMLSFRSHIKTVWFSFQWISASARSPSSASTPHHHRTLMRRRWCGSSGRSGWSDDSCRTTSHLCTSLHTSLTTRRCPGLECWT